MVFSSESSIEGTNTVSGRMDSHSGNPNNSRIHDVPNSVEGGQVQTGDRLRWKLLWSWKLILHHLWVYFHEVRPIRRPVSHLPGSHGKGSHRVLERKVNQSILELRQVWCPYKSESPKTQQVSYYPRTKHRSEL